ncbi:MAG: helix-turn-helix domain-containing protein [Roseomonas sp.]|nr:helix-turn-helix domain-containing protein [Roseomonas sp.]MCA3379745.1 helix-turn-helix domain-containing protein [Roseomonas sp.]
MIEVGGFQAADPSPMAADILAADPAQPLALRCLYETNRHLPPHQQFDAWREANASFLLHHSPPSRPDSYEAEATTWSFGRLALTKAETPGGAYSRTAECLRRDGLDHWCFSMAIQGSRVHRTRDKISLMRPGEIMLDSLAQPFEVARTRSAWLFLYMPRDLLPETSGLAGGRRMLNTPEGRLLGEHLRLLSAELPRMSAAEAERMAEATQAMIALAVAPGTRADEVASGPVAAAQIMRLRALIRANLGSATFGPARLCRLAGISRSQLYRLFEIYGGVALCIQRERLAAAHRALSNPTDLRSISEIAEAVGLFDPSSFSRMFRRSYGISPRELRLATSAGRVSAGTQAPTPAWPAASFPALLRML